LKPDNTVDYHTSSAELGEAAAKPNAPDVIDRLRCIYFFATGFFNVYIRKIYPRLRDFSEWGALPKRGASEVDRGQDTGAPA
jgi:hypothetical protein